MKHLLKSIKTTQQLSPAVLPLLAIILVLPLLILVIFGLIALIDYGYILYFVALLALCALVVMVLRWARRRPSPENVQLADEGLVTASADWSDYDHQVWNRLNLKISLQLKENAEWGQLQEHALALIKAAAENYHDKGSRKEFSFSVPELLMMIEEISRRYRLLLKTHVPFIENARLSLLVQGYDNQEKLKAHYRSAKWVWNSYRMVRLVNPLTAVLAELRSQVIGKMMTQVSAEFQLKLKQALLQEVVSVAIDLYSGRFKVEELHQATPGQDSRNMALPPDPLRICFVGQTGSGKSSIINALVDAMVAEVNPLPSTSATTIHQCRIKGLEMVHLVDLPGLDGKEKAMKKLLKEVTSCDLIIWVLKANQPARSLDCDFKQQLDEFYLETTRRSRKRPAMIGVLNQIDRLPPVQQWQPAYDLKNPETPKAKAIKAALEYNRDLLAFNALIPLAVVENQPAYNLDELKRMIDQHYQQGLQTQLNRRRVQVGGVGSISDQAGRFYQTGKSLFAIIRDKN
ncbi:MAG: GTPase [Pelovirga sp.]